jgi:hypothetical protein
LSIEREWTVIGSPVQYLIGWRADRVNTGSYHDAEKGDVNCQQCVRCQRPLGRSNSLGHRGIDRV